MPLKHLPGAQLSSSATGSFASSLVQRATLSGRLASAGILQRESASEPAAPDATWAPLSEEPTPSMAAMRAAVDDMVPGDSDANGLGLTSDQESVQDDNSELEAAGAAALEGVSSLVSFRHPMAMGLISHESVESSPVGAVGGGASGGSGLEPAAAEARERAAAKQQAPSREDLVMAGYDIQLRDANDDGAVLSAVDGGDSGGESDEGLPSPTGVA